VRLELSRGNPVLASDGTACLEIVSVPVSQSSARRSCAVVIAREPDDDHRVRTLWRLARVATEQHSTLILPIPADVMGVSGRK
jgi:hypothetical protein